jgi:hypothetical protein
LLSSFVSEKVKSQQSMENVHSLLIDFSTLKAATLNFHESNKLGEGGFGAVYKVLLIPIFDEVSHIIYLVFYFEVFPHVLR